MAQLIFVTGSSGFIGCHCVQVLLIAGYTVVGIDRGQPLNGKESFAWHQSAVTLQALEEMAQKHGVPDAIIHCAGSGLVSASFTDPYMDFTANVNPVLDVLEFARKNLCDNNKEVKVIMPSTAAVYGVVSQLPIAEQIPLHPISPYGRHKCMAEELCASYAFHWQVPVVVVRLFSVYGSGLRKQLLWDACKKAQTNDFSFFGTGAEQRDWIHVKDVATLLVLAIEHADVSCPIVNGATGVGISVAEVLTFLGAYCKPALKPTFSGLKKEGDPAHYIADVTRISQWGFEPKIQLEQGVKEYANWFNTSACSENSD